MNAGLFALSIDLKRGSEKGSPYSILHLKDAHPFHCRTYYGEEGLPSLYECLFDRMPPATRFRSGGNDFFRIDFKVEEGRFKVLVEPLKASMLRALPPPIHENPVLTVAESNLSRHWVVLGYEEEPPFLGKEVHYVDGLSFPLDFNRTAIMSVGAVDISGEPVFMKGRRDVEKFMALKEAFAAGRYKKAANLAAEAMELYPDSIFASDFLRYRIKALTADDMKEHADEIVRLGKIFIKKYTADEYLPEVLLLLARVYSATGFVSDADYFFNRLIHEHKGSRFADLGLIYLGDQLYINGKVKEATEKYLEAYYNAKEIDVASLAAYKLAMRYLDRGRSEKAVEYLEKIWKANRAFLLKDPEDTARLAKDLAARRRYGFAIKLASALLEKLKKSHPLYEELLFDIAEWYDEKGDAAKAVAFYRRYLDEFAYGEYSDKAKESLDKLFVVSNDANVTEALERYEALMREYEGSDVAQKALAAKIRLLVENGRYEEALELRKAVEELTDEKAKTIAEEALRKAAREAFAKAFKGGECKKAVVLRETFGIRTPPAADVFLFDCYMRFAEYDKALEIADARLARGSSDKARWLCRAAHALTKAGRYDKAYDALQEYEAFAKKGQNACDTRLWDLFAIHHAAGRFAEEIAVLEELSAAHPRDMRLADLYKKAYEAAKKAGDAIQRLRILERLIALQNRMGAHPYSPWAEFEAIRLYKAAKRYKEALKVAESMKRLSLPPEAEARRLYEAGSLKKLLGDAKGAERSFRECTKLKEGGAWRKLCEEALSL